MILIRNDQENLKEDCNHPWSFKDTIREYFREATAAQRNDRTEPTDRAEWTGNCQAREAHVKRSPIQHNTMGRQNE